MFVGRLFLLFVSRIWFILIFFGKIFIGNLDIVVDGVVVVEIVFKEMFLVVV